MQLAECEWHGQDVVASNLEHAVPSRGLSWLEQARHHVLLMRLQRPYFVYCAVCSLLSAAAFLSTLADLVRQDDAGRRFQDILEGGTWQSACWSVVALALCAEVGTTLVVRGCNLNIFAEDWWFALDAVVVLLTLLSWLLMCVRQASPMREEAEEADLWLLVLRFTLQPCRVFAAAKMAHKVQMMQQSYMDVNFDDLVEAQGVEQQSHFGDSPELKSRATSV